MGQVSTRHQKVTVTCTDNGNVAEAIIEKYAQREYMTVVMASQRIQLKYDAVNHLYVGGAFGMEFTALSKDIYNE